MKMGTIKGGIGFQVSKVDTPIESLAVPAQVVIPLKQHRGSPCKVLVKKGQEVKVGDLIGEVKDEESACVHATVSGKVVDIPKRFPDIRGSYVPAVVIESDGKEEWASLEKEKDVLKCAEAFGIVDGGIDAFPLSKKIKFAKSKNAKTLIINGIDLEPGVSTRYKLVVEKRNELAQGIKLLKSALGATTAYLAIEDTNTVAQNELPSILSGIAELAVLKSKFPQGLDRFVIKAVTGKEVPSPYGLPEDVGVCIVGAETAIAISEAIKSGRPVIDQVVTVYGAVNKPKNLKVRIGTSLKDILSYCGVNGDIAKVVVGGPMMGLAQFTLNVPVTKEITGIYVQRQSELITVSNQKCINCGWCIKTCPMGLLPNIIASYCEVDMFEEAESYNLSYCIECGCCAYICPAKIPLVHWIKYGKSQLKREEQ